MKSFVAILFYLRRPSLLNISQLVKCGKGKREYIEERVARLQALKCGNFFWLELVTWFELVTFNWDKTLEKNISCMQMTPSVILLNIC